MTVDLEDYYCDLPHSTWSRYKSRICDITRDILKMLRESNAFATFFTLGYIAERHPELIEEIISEGHEIASHGHFHVNFKNKTREDFEQDLVKSLISIRKVSKEKIRGFRAPFFSINKQNLWAFEVLKEYLEYDSSILPARIHYRCSGAPKHIYRISDQDPLKIDNKGNFFEVPITVLDAPIVGGLPASGGIYFRVLPFWLIKMAVDRSNKSGFPAVIYIHPKDLDPGFPNIVEYPKYYYWGLNKAKEKFRFLLKNFRFTSIREILPTLKETSSP